MDTISTLIWVRWYKDGFTEMVQLCTIFSWSEDHECIQGVVFVYKTFRCSAWRWLKRLGGGGLPKFHNGAILLFSEVNSLAVLLLFRPGQPGPANPSLDRGNTVEGSRGVLDSTSFACRCMWFRLPVSKLSLSIQWVAFWQPSCPLVLQVQQCEH